MTTLSALAPQASDTATSRERPRRTTNIWTHLAFVDVTSSEVDRLLRRPGPAPDAMSILSRLLLERRLGTDRRRSLRDTPERRGSNRIRYFVAARNGVVIGERSGRTVFTHVVIGSDGDAYLATFHRSREHAEACKSHVFPASTGPRIVAAIETVREMKIGERLREGDMLHPQSSVASH